MAIWARDGGSARGSLRLEPGEVRETLVVEGLPLADLAPATRLRIGGAVVVQIEPPPDRRPGGLREAAAEACVATRVVDGGVVRLGDAVLVEAVPVPLEDALDLHPFRPEEIAAVVTEYLEQVRMAGLAEVRLIHGRGRGVQRETVRRLLATSSAVEWFGDAPPERGGWGATLVRLRVAQRRR